MLDAIDHMRDNRIVRTALAVVLAFMLAIPSALFAMPKNAYAASNYYVGQTFYGNCWIGDYWMVGDQSYFPISGWTGELSDAGTVTMECQDHTAANPYPQTAPYAATITSIDTHSGAVTFSVVITPADVTDGHTYNEFGLVGYQHVGGPLTLYRTFSGWISLDKDSSNPAISDGNSCYSLAGAQYGIFSSYGDAQNMSGAVQTLTTDAEGKATSGDLDPGTYYVRETVQAPGFARDETIYTVEVTAGETTPVNGGVVYDTPQNDPAQIWIGKIDSETTLNMPQGSASLAGAQFMIRYYDGQYSSVEAAEASGTPDRTWVVQTDTDGYARLGDEFLVSGDDFYRGSGGIVTIPLGTLLIQEIQPAEGYLLPDPNPVFVRNITSEGIVEAVTTFNQPIQTEPVIRGGVSIQKTDQEKGGSALGGATLAGAVFSIYNESDNAVIVDGKSVEPGQKVLDITTDDTGYATTRTDSLPYGDYSVREVVAPNGYLGTDQVLYFSITEDGVFKPLHGTDGFQNRVKRGDLQIVKKDESTGTAMAGIPFRITSETTGESHVIVTDANGFASTSSDWNAHSYRTNYNDTATDGNYDSTAGVWFGQGDDGDAPVKDSYGALPYDTYTIEELPCAANADHQLVKQTGVSITRDGWTVDLGTVDDRQASISTTALDSADGDHVVAMGEHAQVIDRVAYSNLIPGRTYTLVGNMVVTDGEQALELGGVPVESTVTFTPDSPNGVVEVAFDLGATVNLLPGDDSVTINTIVYEELFDDSGRSIADHKDPGDTGQQIRIVPPTASTTATDGADGDRTVSSDTDATINDAVAYHYLEAGVQYRVVSAAVPYGSADAVTADDLNAAIGTAENTFTADATGNGIFNVSITADTTNLDDGTSIVLFEWVYDASGNLVASHADKDDASQTVTVKVPVIGTTASDSVDGDQIIVDDGSRSVTLNDTVSYENLVPGKTYTVTGTLMDKETGEELADADGNAITATTEFTPALSAGTTTVAFTFDPSDIPTGGQVVAFETLYRDGVQVAVHADIDDLGQTVTIVRPSIGTTASDAVDGDKQVVSDPEAEINDTVAVQNVVDNKGYKMIGIQMDAKTGLPFVQGEQLESDEADVSAWWDDVKAALGMTDDCTLPATVDFGALQALLDQDGIAQRVVTSDADFSLPDDWGSVDMAFGPFDATGLNDNAQLVVFEALVNTDGNAIIAVHNDLEDIGQTVTVVKPEIGTTAADGFDGDQDVVIDPEATVTDTVAYSGLVPGKTYDVSGTLMNKATGEALTDADGNEVTASATFTPESPDGTVDVVFRFDASALSGETYVAFEHLYRNSIEVAAHTDIEDSGQTINFVQPVVDTVALDGIDGDKNVVADPESKVVDTISYSNLLPGTEYTAHGILMDADTGLPLVTGDGSLDITDQQLTDFWDQMIDLLNIQQDPEFGAADSIIPTEGVDPDTQAALSQLADMFINAAEESGQDISDLLPDDSEPSTLIATQADWDGIGELLLANPDITACLSTSEATFLPDRASGEIQSEFDLTTQDIAGKNVVVFEVLTKADSQGGVWTVAAHGDLSDEDQTVQIVPSEIGTEATDKSDGDHQIIAGPNATLVDTISYTNLIPGKEYTISGVLMDKDSNSPLMVGGNQVTAEERFVPNHTDGTVTLEFSFDATGLEGTTVVAFEHLYKDGIEVATHADINDEAQSVSIVAGPSSGANGSPYDKTGADTTLLILLIICAVAIGGGAGAYALRQRKLARSAAESAATSSPHDNE